MVVAVNFQLSYYPAIPAGPKEAEASSTSAKSWNVPTGLEQAFLLARAHDDIIDWNYVQDESRKADIADYLAELKGMLAKRAK
jgi:hypothetical protein